MTKKEILNEWLRFVDKTNFKEGHYNCILEAMEEYAQQQVKNCSIPLVSESCLEDRLYNKCLESMPDMTKKEFEEALNTWLHQYTKSKQIEDFNPHSR